MGILKKKGLSKKQAILKRIFDVIGSLLGLIFTSWIILFSFFLASLDTRSFGFFIQKRVGKSGHFFHMVKIRTMRPGKDVTTTVTTRCDPRITALGRVFRITKIDELPQLFNVLTGQMSFVGPRPDVPGFADKLEGEDRIILSIRPGITGPATINFRDEEALLAKVKCPEVFNREIIFPEKVRLNKLYIENYSFLADIKYIIKTIFHNE